ncbi:MAG: hypothetical protein IKE64_10965 [Thermoguttaceae bacterium]|nr:hypothetical protein [Thermoguttaceae bacterium]
MVRLILIQGSGRVAALVFAFCLIGVWGFTAEETEPAKEGEPVRVWHSGRFETEAVLAGTSRDGRTVTLRKPGGGVVCVPYKKLSREDRDYVREYRRRAREVNPFEEDISESDAAGGDSIGDAGVIGGDAAVKPGIAERITGKKKGSARAGTKGHRVQGDEFHYLGETMTKSGAIFGIRLGEKAAVLLRERWWTQDYEFLGWRGNRGMFRAIDPGSVTFFMFSIGTRGEDRRIANVVFFLTDTSDETLASLTRYLVENYDRVESDKATSFRFVSKSPPRVSAWFDIFGQRDVNLSFFHEGMLEAELRVKNAGGEGFDAAAEPKE